jgi:uncharacterized caspase-like protein
MMIRVRKEVMQETANKQVPWEEAALNESFFFVSPATPASPSPTSSPGKAQAVKGGGSTRTAPGRSNPGGSNLPPNVGAGIGAGL